MNTKDILWLSLLAILITLLMASPAVAGWQPAPVFGLGAAGEYAVLSLGKPSAETDGQSRLDLSAVTIHGDVGVRPYGVLDFQGPSTIDGDLLIDRTLLLPLWRAVSRCNWTVRRARPRTATH